MNGVTKFAQIEPTTRCNYSCGFCAGRFMKQADLAWDLFECFLAAHPSLEHVELQGEGEPFLHPRFLDMVSACRVRGIRVSIITNGSALGVQAVERLLSDRVDSVHISLESADPNEFSHIRGGKLDKVIAGIQLLIRRRRDHNIDRPKVGFSVTVLRRTAEAVLQIIALYKALGLDGGIAIQKLQTMTCYTDKYDEPMLQEIVPEEQWRDYVRAFHELMRDNGLQIGGPSYYDALFADFDPHSGKCPWLEKGAYLGCDGSVTGCCVMKHPAHAFGNIGADSLQTIDDRRRMLAITLAKGEIPAPCIGCPISDAITRPQKQHSVIQRGEH